MNDLTNLNYICSKCGSTMKPADEEVLVCTSCNHSVDIEDYEYENEYDDYYSSINDDVNPPKYCLICGGPYPDCMTSCKLFDD